MTICHHTDAGYVAVVITADQSSPHFDEDADIIPAPSTGCEGITDPGQAGRVRVTVCHRNPDGTFTLHDYDAGDLGGHEGDKGDLIPAPNGVCPNLAGTPTATPTPSPTATGTPPPELGDGDFVSEATAVPTRVPKAKPTATAAPVRADHRHLRHHGGRGPEHHERAALHRPRPRPHRRARPRLHPLGCGPAADRRRA